MSAQRKVLVVDDDPVVGKSFNRVLSDKGYIVITAENGYDALMKLQEEKYDVVFTDIKMPGMNGLEVAERVKQNQPWTPVVIVTGYGTKANEERAKAVGVSEFLRKPLSPEMIEETTVRALHLAEAPQAAPPQEEPAAVPQAQPAAAKKPNVLKNMLLFLSAPFVGLVYAILLPFVGIGMLAWVAGQAVMKQPKAVAAARAVMFGAKLIAAPFIGLAYIVLFPFAGLAMLAWIGGKALVTRRVEE
ncbi:MAG TPA: response regulator [Noviherbaspirillum sp.]|uniref:response regulator n=1 Tax=Noviherbaspirillum sp. TaxID=1926288 RepID=UPI002B45E87E|nr:response regulator [Noviherbaspirillum sp.]HJV88414.1 response regulator [Noviherbaspirillum sp.]